jgi:hypothetical protein
MIKSLPVVSRDENGNEDEDEDEDDEDDEDDVDEEIDDEDADPGRGTQDKTRDGPVNMDTWNTQIMLLFGAILDFVREDRGKGDVGTEFEWYFKYNGISKARSICSCMTAYSKSSVAMSFNRHKGYSIIL